MSKASWTMQTRQAAINYESFGLWGGEVGLMAYGCFKGLAKSLAVFNWCKSNRCNKRNGRSRCGWNYSKFLS
jgi:hypothetical protein